MIYIYKYSILLFSNIFFKKNVENKDFALTNLYLERLSDKKKKNLYNSNEKKIFLVNQHHLEIQIKKV
jgi:hypothetical protein